MSVAHHEPAWQPTVMVRMLHSTYMGRLDMHVDQNVAPMVSREEDASLEILQHGLELNPTP